MRKAYTMDRGRALIATLSLFLPEDRVMYGLAGGELNVYLIKKDPPSNESDTGVLRIVIEDDGSGRAMESQRTWVIIRAWPEVGGATDERVIDAVLKWATPLL